MIIFENIPISQITFENMSSISYCICPFKLRMFPDEDAV